MAIAGRLEPRLEGGEASEIPGDGGGEFAPGLAAGAAPPIGRLW